MDPAFIYVNPATCDPAFLFLPLQNGAGTGIRGLLEELVFHDRIEMANDNLVQMLLKEMNREPFSLDSLERAIKPYAEKKHKDDWTNTEKKAVDGYALDAKKILGSREQEFRVAEHRKMEPENLEVRMPNPMDGSQATGRPETLEQGKDKKAALPFRSAKKNHIKEKNSIGTMSVPKAKKERKKTADSKEKSQAEEGQEFDAEAAKKKFLFPQAIVMVVTAAAISFGVFFREDGSLATDLLLAYMIFLAVFEVILYREIYVNGKKLRKESGKKDKNGLGKNRKEKGEKEKAEKGKEGKRPELPKPPMPSRTPVPMDAPKPPVTHSSDSSASSASSISSTPVSPVIPTAHSVPSISTEQSEAAWPQELFAQERDFNQAALSASGLSKGQEAVPWFAGKFGQTKALWDEEDTDLAEETQLLGDEQEYGFSAYLEYFEAGVLKRVPVSFQNGLVIGRLKSQVDFVVSSPKVGKLHAKFFCQNGRYYVVDINSKNGTYINGSRSRIESNVPHLLHDKDRIKLADCEFTIRCPEF